MGFGKGRKSKEISKAEWVEGKLNYLDTKTFYRNEREIKILFDKYFLWDHREEEIINFRAVHLKNNFGEILKKLMEFPGLKQLGKFAFTRMAGYLIIAYPK